jgi:hypothetical protein
MCASGWSTSIPAAAVCRPADFAAVRQMLFAAVRQMPFAAVRQMPFAAVRQMPFAAVRQMPFAAVRQMPFAAVRRRAFGPACPARNARRRAAHRRTDRQSRGLSGVQSGRSIGAHPIVQAADLRRRPER